MNWYFMFDLVTSSKTHVLREVVWEIWSDAMFWGNTLLINTSNIGKGFPEELTFDLDPEDLARTQPGTQLEEEANGILV